MRLTQALLRAVQQRPQACALICEERRTSYAQLQERVARLAGALRSLGVREGHTVALLGASSDRQVECHLAVSWTGAIACPLDARLGLADIVRHLTESESVAACLDEAFAPHTDALLDACPYLRALIFCGSGACPDGWIGMETLIERNEPMPPAETDEHAPGGVFYVPGARAGVELSQRNLCSTAIALMAEGPFREGCVALQGFPLADPLGAVTTACVLLAGGTLVLPAAAETRLDLDLVERHQITDWLLIPARLLALAEGGAPDVPPCPSLRHLLCPSAPDQACPLPAALRAFPGSSAFLLYGPAEASGFATLLKLSEDAPAPLPLQALGRGGPHVQLSIVDGDGRELPAGAVGELRLRGDNVMLGYCRRPELSAVALRDGWLHTGEFGHLDENGGLHHCGRPSAIQTDHPAGTAVPAGVVPPADAFAIHQTRL